MSSQTELNQATELEFMFNNPNKGIQLLIDKMPSTPSSGQPEHPAEWCHYNIRNKQYKLFTEYLQNPNRKTLSTCINYSSFFDNSDVTALRNYLTSYILETLPDDSQFLQKK